MNKNSSQIWTHQIPSGEMVQLDHTACRRAWKGLGAQYPHIPISGAQLEPSTGNNRHESEESGRKDGVSIKE